MRAISILVLSFLLVFTICYGFYFPEPFFLLDDGQLIDSPQLKSPLTLGSISSIFTPGTQVDFYPVRDLSHLIEIHLLGAKPTGETGTLFRATNLILFAGTGFCLYFLLLSLSVLPTFALVLVGFWLFNPVHAETILWISSRKDLLSLFFGVSSVLFFIKLILRNQRKFALGSMICFILSIFSKASLCLLPLVAAFHLFRRGNPRASRLAKVTTIGLCTIGLLGACYQSRFYSHFNDMRFFYPFDYRLLAGTTALGRMVVGWLYAPVNAIDVYNWGDWASYYKGFAPLGILFLLSLLGLLYFSIKTKREALILGVLGFFLLYLPVSGMVFPHRNFYSVRYLEAPLLFLGVCVAVSLNAVLKPIKVKATLVWISVFVLCAGLSLETCVEGRRWESGLSVINKSLALAPLNPAISLLKLQEMYNLKRWGRLNKDELTHLTALESTLRRNCSGSLDKTPSLNGDLCSMYFSHIQQSLRDKKSLTKEEEIELEQIDQWLLRHIQILNPLQAREYQTYLNMEKLLNGTGDKEEMTHLQQAKLSPVMNTKESLRLNIWAINCIYGNRTEAKNLYLRWKNQALVSLQSTKSQISQLMHRTSLASAGSISWKECLP